MTHASQVMSHESPAIVNHESDDIDTFVRAATPTDRQAIYDLLMHSDIFGREDADCVDEMFRGTWSALADNPNADTYHWLTCYGSGDPSQTEPQTLLGFACFGTESLTQGTWDLFWICVAPAARGKGVGGRLMNNAVAQAKEAGARLMVIYTSSTEPYQPARRLYESQEFSRVAAVEDYYRDGDHLYIYTKRLR